MKTRRLGADGPEVSALGMGCSGMSGKSPRNDAESMATIQAALDAGLGFLNTADFYGAGHNEQLIARAIKGRRDEAFLNVKCGVLFDPAGRLIGVDCRPESVKNFAAYTLQRLGVEVIDLYQPCRVDPAVPFEDTIGAIKDLIDEGKVRYLGVSEVDAALLRRAHDVHPVTAIEVEYSLACRFSESDILPTARELRIGVVPYRVLADGLLSGKAKKAPADGDPRMQPPRLEGENFDHNQQSVAALIDLAHAKQCTPVQLAVAWLLAQGTDIVPLVGMSHRGRLPDNLAILDIALSADELGGLDQAFGPDAIRGERFAAALAPFLA